VARLNSTGGTPQKEFPKSTRACGKMGATSNSAKLSSRLLLIIAFLRSTTEEIVTDFLVAPFFFLGSFSS
jgi:hypothetical protein